MAKGKPYRIGESVRAGGLGICTVIGVRPPDFIEVQDSGGGQWACDWRVVERVGKSEPKIPASRQPLPE